MSEIAIAIVDGLVAVVAAVAVVVAREYKGVEVTQSPLPVAAVVLGTAAEQLGKVFMIGVF